MYLETYRESGSFKHYGYEPERDGDFGGLYCAKSDSTSGEAEIKPTSGGTGSGGSGGPTGRNIR